jgi:hypothetical protein
MVDVGEPNSTANPIEAVRIVVGLFGSVLTGDIFDSDAPPMEYPDGGCEYLITVNGIWNTEENAREILKKARTLPFYKNIAGSSYASNGTHFDLDPRGPTAKDKNRVGLGDLIQILINETLRAIDISAKRLADRINGALDAMKAEGCKCPCLHILAHSQGAMVTDMALALVPEEEKKNITVVTVGPEKPLPDYESLKFVYNLAHIDDPVPMAWGSTPLANGGRGLNIFRVVGNRAGTLHVFGTRKTYKGYDAHDFNVYANELARNPPKGFPSCAGAKKGNN